MIYKFRAEALDDIANLDFILKRSGKKITHLRYHIDKKTLDKEIEIGFDYLDIEALRNYMRLVIDGHTMVQTLMPLEKYTGERNYEL